jgi:hypothetical protein
MDGNLKSINMKKTNIKLFLFALALVLVACEKYNDYLIDSIGYSATYFPYQQLKRSAIAGEGLQIKIGVYMGGVRENKKDQIVKFKIDPSLLASKDPATGIPYGTLYQILLLPPDYYTLSSPDEIVIPAGSFIGFVTVTFDSLKMVNDPKLKTYTYAFPLTITSSTTEQVLETKRYTFIPIKLINTFEGNYYPSGRVKQFTTASNALDTTYVYGDTLNVTLVTARPAETVSADMVVVTGLARESGGTYKMQLKVNADKSVVVLPVAGSPIQVQPNGSSRWEPVKRKFFLNYKYTLGTKTYQVKESLIFRNRIRDGISEWRWDGFPGN